MMQRPPTAKGRPLAIAVLLFALLAGTVAVAVPHYLLHRHYDTRLEDLQDRLATYRRVSASRDAYDRELAQLHALDGRRLYLRESAPALAAGYVQETVKSVIESHGGRLVSMQILPHKEEDGVLRVAVNARAMGDLASLQAILLTLESGEPFLFVDNLSLAVQRDAPGSGGDELILQLDVFGYAPKGAAG